MARPSSKQTGAIAAGLLSVFVAKAEAPIMSDADAIADAQKKAKVWVASESQTANDFAVAKADIEPDPPSDNDNKYSVGIADLTEEELANAQWNASRYSKDGMIILYMGSNKDLLAKVQAGASEAHNAGQKVKGIIHAKPTPKFDNKDCYIILMGGTPVTKYVDASVDTQDRAKRMVNGSHARFSSYLTVASNDGPGNDQP